MILIDEVCSFGTLCHSAYFFKENNLKHCSYPFDWIFSNIEMIIDCLDNNFSTFMNKELFIEKEDKTKCGHKTYHPDMFNHKNPLLEEDYNYYKRCIERFNELIKSEKNKLFMMMFVNNNPKNFENNDNKINFFTEFLSKHIKNANYFFVIHFSNRKQQKYEIKNLSNNITILYLYTKSTSNGTVFLNNKDNLFFKSIFFKLYSINNNTINNNMINNKTINNIKNNKINKKNNKRKNKKKLKNLMLKKRR